MSDVVMPAESRAEVGEDRRFIGADDCATRFAMSRRHWLRLVDSGRAPRPVRFGRLVRWSIETLAEWERDGCRPVRVPKGGVR